MAIASAGRIKAGAAYIEITADNSKLLHGLRAVQLRLRTLGQSLKGVGADLMQTAGAMSIPVVMAVKSFADFDDKIRALGAISGASASQLQSLSSYIRHLGATTAFTAQQVAQGAVELSRMGFRADELAQGLKPTMDLVRATGSETHRLGEITEYAAASLRIFGLNSSNFSDVCDVMAFAANRSAMNIADLGEAMKIAGPSAKTVNEDLRDTASALMLLSNAGIKGSLAGTSLRKIYQSLAAQSGKTEGLSQDEIDQGIRGAEQLSALGIRIVDPNTGNLRKAADIMVDLARAVRRMKTGDKINFATDVFDLRGSLGALSMLNDPNMLQNFRNQLNNTGGYASRTADQIEKGIGGMIRFLISQFQEMQIAIGEAIYDTFGDYVKKIPVVTKIIVNFIKQHKKLIAIFAAVIVGSFTLGIALFALGSIFKTLAFGIGGICSLLSLFSKMLLLPINAIKMIISVFAALKASLFAIAQVIANLLTLAPLFLIAAGLAAIVAVVWKLTGAFDILKNSLSSTGKSFSQAFTNMKNTTLDALGAIKKAILNSDFEGASKITLAALALVWQQGIAPLRELWADTVYFFQDSWALLAYFLADVGWNIWKGVYVGCAWMWKQIVAVVGTSIDGLKLIWTLFSTSTLKAANVLWTALLKGLFAIGTLIRNAWNGLWNGIINAFEQTVLEIQKAWIRTKGMFDSEEEVKAEIVKVEEAHRRRKRKREKSDALDDTAWTRTGEAIARKGKERNDELVGEMDDVIRELDKSAAERKAKLEAPIDTSFFDTGIKENEKELQRNLNNNRKEYQRSLNESQSQISDAQKKYDAAKDFAERLPVMRRVIDQLTQYIEQKMSRQDFFRALRSERGRSVLKGTRSMNKNNVIQEQQDTQKLFERLQDQYRDTLKKASEDRIIDDTEKAELRRLADQMRFQRAKLDIYKQLLADSESAVENGATRTGIRSQNRATVGAWSIESLKGLTGTSLAQRSAKAAENAVNVQRANGRTLQGIWDTIKGKRSYLY